MTVDADPMALLAAWRPTITKCGRSVVSLSDQVRSTTTPKVLTELWHQSTDVVQHDPALLKSFIKGATDWGRRCALLAEPLLFDIAGQPNLDLDDFTSLAVATSDVNSRRLVERLLERTQGTRQYVAFYFSLIRCATEFLRPVDMVMATDITRIMAEVQIEMYIPHVRMLIHGFGRLPEPPLGALENIVDACLAGSPPGVPLDPSILHELLSIFERLRGCYAKHALKIVTKLGLANCAKLVSSVYVRPADHKRDEDKTFTTFYIVDPYAFPVDRVPIPPPLLRGATKWYILFPFSCVRHMIECNHNFLNGNPFLEGKLSAMKALIQASPANVFVFPADLELQMRSDGRDGVAEDTPNGRYLSFLESFVPQIENPDYQVPQEASLVFVTQNAQLRASLEARIEGHQNCPIRVQSDFTQQPMH
jgi:hypothetical protein